MFMYLLIEYILMFMCLLIEYILVIRKFVSQLHLFFILFVESFLSGVCVGVGAPVIAHFRGHMCYL